MCSFSLRFPLHHPRANGQVSKLGSVVLGEGTGGRYVVHVGAAVASASASDEIHRASDFPLGNPRRAPVSNGHYRGGQLVLDVRDDVWILRAELDGFDTARLAEPCREVW